MRRIEGTPVEHRGNVPLFAVKPKSVVTGKIIGRTGQMTPVTLETKIGRLLAKVPLADHGSEIPRFGKYFCDSCTTAKPGAAGLVAVKSGHQRHTRGVALGRIVELGKPQAIRGESIQSRGFDLGTITSQIGEAQIVHHDKDNVGTFAGCGSCERYMQENNNEYRDEFPQHELSFPDI